MYDVVHFNIDNFFISMLLLHILSTRELSNITDSNKFALFGCGISTRWLCPSSEAVAFGEPSPHGVQKPFVDQKSQNRALVNGMFYSLEDVQPHHSLPLPQIKRCPRCQAGCKAFWVIKNQSGAAFKFGITKAGFVGCI